MNYDIEKCGKRIRQLRIKKGLTQEKTANALNIDQSFYGRVETGKKGCSVDMFIQLSILFGVSLDYLILGRCLGELPNGADTPKLKNTIGELIEQLEEFKRFL